MADKPTELNDRQETFCRYYVIDPNGKKAAIEAGYSESGANVQAVRLLRNVTCLEYIDKLRAERNARLEWDADTVLKESIDLYYHARDQGNLTIATRALELAGKHSEVGAYRERVEIEVVGDLEAKLNAAETRATAMAQAIRDKIH